MSGPLRSSISITRNLLVPSVGSEVLPCLPMIGPTICTITHSHEIQIPLKLRTTAPEKMREPPPEIPKTAASFWQKATPDLWFSVQILGTAQTRAGEGGKHLPNPCILPSAIWHDCGLMIQPNMNSTALFRSTGIINRHGLSWAILQLSKTHCSALFCLHLALKFCIF